MTVDLEKQEDGSNGASTSLTLSSDAGDNKQQAALTMPPTKSAWVALLGRGKESDLDSGLTVDHASGELDYSKVDSPEDVETLKGQTDIPKQTANILTMYRFLEPVDMLILFVGVFFAIVHGVSLPMFTLVVGGITNNFNEFLTSAGGFASGDFQHQVDHNTLYFVYIGISIMGSACLESFILVQLGERLSSRYRKAYLRAIIRQNIAYFDKLGSGEVTTRITNDTTAIQEAISEKSGNIISGFATFITAIIIAFVTQWKLSCILLSGVFFIIASMIICSNFMIQGIVDAEKVYSNGSSIAEEAFSAIRNTVAFGIQEKMAERFDIFLKKSRYFTSQSNFYLAVMLGLLWGGVFWVYALSFWEGSRLIADGDMNIGKVIVVLSAMLIGAFQIGNLAPNFQFIAKGVAAAASINETINRVPVIDSLSDEGLKPETLDGHIIVQNIRFRYPSRPDVLVLPDFSLDVKPGQTVALVGASGSGKSTIIGLLERFYLPLSGSITIDGIEIKDLNLRWLRQQIGYVSQEPTLFSDSIFDNIAYGLIGTEFENASQEVKREKVIDACKQANAWDFIQQLTDGLDTNVGDRGFLMSGGQKQRIAIARAIISDPKILLLDEATSALDTKSEGIVQEALDRAAKHRSTIVIAHRLSTIKDADKIVVLDKGVVVEQGTHHSLLEAEGHYFRLVAAQKVAGADRAGPHGKDEKTVHGLEVHEDAFVIEDDGLSKSESHPARQEVKISGMQQVDVSFGKIVAMLWRINIRERKQILLGAVFAVLLGMGYPSLAMLMGRTVQRIMVPPEQYPEMRKHVNLYSGMFFMVGWEQVITGFLMIKFLTYASEELLRNIRLSLFRQYLRMDIAFYDHKDNSSGSLTSVLAKDGKAIEGFGGATFGQIMNCCVMLFAGLIVGIAFNWKLGLVGTACVPLLVGSGFLRLHIMTRLQNSARSIYEDSGAMASQYATAVRTVQSLTREDGVQSVYDSAIDRQLGSSRLSVFQSAIFYGFSEACTPWVLSLIFWYGSTLLREGKLGIWAYYVVFVGVIFGAQAAGSIFSYTPDMGKARQSSGNVFRVLEARPEIDTWSTAGTPLVSENVNGDIDFNNIYFRYPTRPQVPVLRGVDISVKRGQFVALVGPSGSGKSTAIGLIERFYNPGRGEILLDGQNIQSLNLNDYRKQIALVQQEPTLYSGTVRENIVFGWHGHESEVTDEMVHEAAKKANIHDFIMSLPDAYETTVGSHGGLLSGGQKQRIAIARALIRDPKILLLDEATSALDSESEKVVQAALDVAAKGRTTVAVAHRLSTIQNADIIYVFEAGKIVEKGRHEELLALKGRYEELVRLQSLEN